jgi:hypothetical protein
MNQHHTFPFILKIFITQLLIPFVIAESRPYKLSKRMQISHAVVSSMPPINVVTP